MTELQQAVEHRLVVAAVARRVMKAREDEGAFMSLVIRQEPEQTPIVMVPLSLIFFSVSSACAAVRPAIRAVTTLPVSAACNEAAMG